MKDILLEDKISSNNYKLYKSSSSFWLADSEDKYLGHISGDVKGIYFLISESFTTLKTGF